MFFSSIKNINQMKMKTFFKCISYPNSDRLEIPKAVFRNYFNNVCPQHGITVPLREVLVFYISLRSTRNSMWITHGWVAIKRVVPIVKHTFIIVHIIENENWFIIVFGPNGVGLDLIAGDARGPSTPFNTSTLALVQDVIVKNRSDYRLPDDMAKVANVEELLSIKVKFEGGDLHTLDLRVEKGRTPDKNRFVAKDWGKFMNDNGLKDGDVCSFHYVVDSGFLNIVKDDFALTRWYGVFCLLLLLDDRSVTRIAGVRSLAGFTGGESNVADACADGEQVLEMENLYRKRGEESKQKEFCEELATKFRCGRTVQNVPRLRVIELLLLAYRSFFIDSKNFSLSNEYYQSKNLLWGKMVVILDKHFVTNVYDGSELFINSDEVEEISSFKE
ncbi:hypothetical protein SSX86_032570, partial [Deinandra increscens subsp. villosa]